MSNDLDIRLTNDHSELQPLIDQLENFLEQKRVAPTPAYRIHLAIDEFFNNSVDYGYPDGRKGEIRVHIRHLENRLELTFSDDGAPFDPFGAPAADTSSDIENRRIGGLGVHLVRTLSDSFAYQREYGRNIINLRFNLTT